MIEIINNLLFEKPSGYFLHQFDTEGTMGTDAIYLL
jgi:hypothetical protein